MKNITIVLIGLLSVFSSKFCAQVMQGDMLLGWFGEEKKNYIGEVISVESDNNFTLRFSHSNSLYKFINISNKGTLGLAKVSNTIGGKYAKNQIFSYLTFREGAGDEDFLKIKFFDGKPYIGYPLEGFDKYYTVQIAHSSNIYKMGYDDKVYETGKGIYKAGTLFTTNIYGIVDNSVPPSTIASSNSKDYIEKVDKAAIEKFLKKQQKSYEMTKKALDILLNKAKKAFEEANLKQ